METISTVGSLLFFSIISHFYFPPSSFKSHETNSGSPISLSFSWGPHPQDDFLRSRAPSAGDKPGKSPSVGKHSKLDSEDEGLSPITALFGASALEEWEGYSSFVAQSHGFGIVSVKPLHSRPLRALTMLTMMMKWPVWIRESQTRSFNCY